MQPDIRVKWLELEIVASGDTRNSRFLKKKFDIVEILKNALNNYNIKL